MRRAYKVTVDGNSKTRYFIDGAEVDQDWYIAEYYKDYGSVPTDANISLTVRQEADDAGQTTESGQPGTASDSGDFAGIGSADATNPGGVTGLDDTVLH